MPPLNDSEHSYSNRGHNFLVGCYRFIIGLRTFVGYGTSLARTMVALSVSGDLFGGVRSPKPSVGASHQNIRKIAAVIVVVENRGSDVNNKALEPTVESPRALRAQASAYGGST